MINIEDYNFEIGYTKCLQCPIGHPKCINAEDFEEAIEDKFEESREPACTRFKITKKIKDENSNN